MINFPNGSTVEFGDTTDKLAGTPAMTITLTTEEAKEILNGLSSIYYHECSENVYPFEDYNEKLSIEALQLLKEKINKAID